MDILLGLQWGDEGKGKVVDFLSPNYQVVTRFQGGPNAGHTLIFEGKKYVLHQIPSGVFRENTTNIIGNGVVLDPVILQQEILQIENSAPNLRKNLYISEKAHLILPTHRLLDAAYEKQKGDKKIGSTLKGIGPVYQDKIARGGIRVGDITSPNFKEKYQQVVERHKKILAFYDFEYDLTETETTFFDALEKLSKLNITNTEYLLNQKIKEGKQILAEGAQGTMLDIDFGSYPFVTSSNTFSGGASCGLGIAPQQIKEVFGIFKAYCTRVGSGPFPTELFDDDGRRIQTEGGEFGATTGRPRRCGWIDLPALKYAIMINGVTKLYMMKADILSMFDTIKVCTHYELENGTATDKLPFDLITTKLKPIYKELKGWKVAITACETMESLPKELHDYVVFLEENLGVSIEMVSVGPDRKQTIMK